MQKLQLYIDTIESDSTVYQRVDLFKDETVSLTQSIQNVRDLAKIFTDFTQTFTIPASKENNKLFRHYNNFNISNTFDARNRVPAKIELNNIPFKKGSVRLDGTELKNNKIYAYKLTFFGETVNLKTLLEDDELQSLGQLDDHNLDYTDSNIRAKLVTTPSTIIAPLISHTDQLFYNSATNTYGNGNLYVRPTNPSTSPNQVYWKQLKFAIRLHTIIEAIQTKYTTANNYSSNIVFSSDFFNTSNTPYYMLYMWLHRKKGDVEPAQQVSLQYRQLTSLTTFSVDTPPGQQTSISFGAITVPGFLVSFPNNILDFSLSFQANQSNTYYVQVYRNASTIVLNETVTTGTVAKIFTNNDFTLSAGTYTIFIASESTTTFSSGNIRWAINGFLGGEAAGGGPQGGYTDEYRSTGLFSTSTTFQFSITQQIPKMKIIDFLTSLFKMFNLTAFVEDDGTIKVQTLDSFYAAGKGVLSGTEAWELDEYIDTTKRQVNVALPFKEIGFQYKGLKTFLAVQYQQLENTGWGSNSYSLEQAKFTAPGDTYKVEIPFEHMQFERLANGSGGGSTTIQWGWSADESRNATHGLPIIFYPVFQSGGTPISFGFDSGNKTSQSSYIIPSNSVGIIPTGTGKKNIHFITETNEYTNNTQFTDNLFADYYSTYINDVFDNQRRLTKVTAYLPLKIIYNLKMNDRVSIGTQEYIINTIKTNLTNGKSDIELLNVVL